MVDKPPSTGGPYTPRQGFIPPNYAPDQRLPANITHKQTHREFALHGFYLDSLFFNALFFVEGRQSTPAIVMIASP